MRAFFVKHYVKASCAFLGMGLLSLILSFYYSVNGDKKSSSDNLSASAGFTASALILIWKGREWQVKRND